MYRGILIICIALVLSSASMATEWTSESDALPAGLQAAIDAFYTAIDSGDGLRRGVRRYGIHRELLRLYLSLQGQQSAVAQDQECACVAADPGGELAA